MSEFIGSIWWLLVSLGVLVTFHEFGHYWVARRCGVKVLRFSVGFGKPLWIAPRQGRHRVCDRRDPARRLRQDARRARRRRRAPANCDQAFNRQSVCKRIAIVVAGPVANLLLCVGLFWAMFVIGRPDYAPVVGQAQGMAASAGLRSGDTLLAVGDRDTPTWSEAQLALIPAALDHSDVAPARAHRRRR